MAKQSFKVTVVSEDSTAMNGNKIRYLNTDKPEIVSHLVEIDPGGEVGRHKHPVPVYNVLEGRLVVEADGVKGREFRAGEALVEDAETWFNNKNPGKEPAKFLAVINGEKDNAPVVFPDK